jgi:peptide/nickel transport system substrate-binding protein
MLGGTAAVLSACGPATPAAPGGALATAGAGAGSTTAAPATASSATVTSGASGTPASASTAAGGATPAPRMGGTLRVLAGGSRITLASGYDPIGVMNQGARAESLMFEGLTRIQDDFSIAPQLAESWTVSPDGKTYTFKIRQGVKFHNGRQMEASDVKYSIERLKDPGAVSPARLQYAVIDAVDAPDPGTAVFSLKQPYSPLLALLADDPSSIVPHEEVEKGNFATNPVGTGPFKFVSHVVDQQAVFERHPDYWQPGFPRLDRLEVTDVLNLQADFLRFRSGAFDAFQEAPEDQFEATKAQLPVALSRGTNWVYFRMNWDRVPQFKDQRVRQALSWAIDRQQLASFSLPGDLVRTNGGSGPLVAWAAPVEPWVYRSQDLAKARQLLSDAGVSNLKFEIQTMASVAYLPKSLQVIQQMLSSIGVTVTTTVLERAPTAAQIPTIDSYLGGSPGGFDPDNDMTQWFTPGGPLNYFNYGDDQVTDWVSRARSMTDQAQRAPLYQQAQKRLSETSNVLFLYNNAKFDAMAPYVKGWVYPGPAIHRWPEAKQIWLDK